MFLSDLPSQVQALTRGSTHTRAYLREGGMAMVGSVEFTKEKYKGVMIGEEEEEDEEDLPGRGWRRTKYIWGENQLAGASH